MKELEESEIGMAGADERHNNWQSDFTTYLKTYVQFVKKYSKYKVYSQEPVEEDRETKIPDVCIKDAKTKKCVFLIEITNILTDEKKKAKVYRDGGIKAEIFVYDYIKNIWYKVDENADFIKDESKSEFLKFKLDNLTKKPLKEMLEKLYKRYIY